MASIGRRRRRKTTSAKALRGKRSGGGSTSTTTSTTTSSRRSSSFPKISLLRPPILEKFKRPSSSNTSAGKSNGPSPSISPVSVADSDFISSFTDTNTLDGPVEGPTSAESSSEGDTIEKTAIVSDGIETSATKSRASAPALSPTTLSLVEGNDNSDFDTDEDNEKTVAVSSPTKQNIGTIFHDVHFVFESEAGSVAGTTGVVDENKAQVLAEDSDDVSLDEDTVIVEEVVAISQHTSTTSSSQEQELDEAAGTILCPKTSHTNKDSNSRASLPKIRTDGNNDINSDTWSSLAEGIAVHIIGGKHENKFGVISSFSKTGNSAYISIDGISKDPLVNNRFLKVMEPIATNQPAQKGNESAKEDDDRVVEDPFVEGAAVHIIYGKYKGKSGIISRFSKTGKSAYITIDGISKDPRVPKSPEYLSILLLNEVNNLTTEIVGETKEKMEEPSLLTTPKNFQFEIPSDGASNVSPCTGVSLLTGTLSPVAGSNETNPEAAGNISTGSTTNFSAFHIGQLVNIGKGTHRGFSGRVVKINNVFLSVQVEGKGKVKVSKNSIEGYASASSISSNFRFTKSAAIATDPNTGTHCTSQYLANDGNEWRIADSQAGGTRFGSRIIEKMRLATQSKPTDDTFLSYHLGNRIKIIEIELSAAEASNPFDIEVQDNAYRYELISAKVKQDNDASGLQYCKKMCMQLIYAQVSGPLLEDLSVEKILSDIADFSLLDPRKVMARLELLQSPVLKTDKGKGIFILDSTDACETEDNGNDGCGFIDETYLSKLLGGNKYARDTTALQIRLFSPRLGVYKGMLMRKRIVNGPPIQLQPSMKKVLPSRTNTSSTKACLVVTQAGRHPNKTNSYIGRLVDPSLKSPPKSFNKAIKPLNKKPMKENADMIPRLFQGVGVPRNVVDNYARKAKKMSGLNHAYIVGVADPTDALPPGHVFITGFSKVSTPNDEIFVTRSPCVKASDARMVPIVTSKPNDMSRQNWDWLLALPFGTVVFANPQRGTRPLPVQIASGDLDGDLYFICWNTKLLSLMKTDPIVELEIESTSSDDGKEEDEKAEAKSDIHWLKKAQQLMVSSIEVGEIGALTGELYKLSQKTADDSSLFMRDEDATAFANAFNKALEYKKHGGKIKLPAHLHCLISDRLRKHVSC